jgi:hypothetical protein
MKSSFVFFVAMLLVALSCDKENVALNSAPTDRLVFRDMADFDQTYIMLLEKSTTEQLAQWATEKNHTTLLDTEDPSLENYSGMLKTILNKDYEFQVGDNIIWFNEGTLYSFSKDQEPQLSELKRQPEKCTKYGTVTSTAIGAANSPNGRPGTAPIQWNGLNAQNQRQFTQQTYQPCGGTLGNAAGNRKYVHEVYDETYSVAPGPVYYSHLVLRIKLEWKGSGSWKPAGEQRRTTVSVSGWAQMIGSGLPQYFYNINVSNDCYSGAWYIPIVNAQHGPFYSEPPFWQLNMDGVINHNVKGDVSSNAWANTECPNCNPATSLLW